MAGHPCSSPSPVIDLQVKKIYAGPVAYSVAKAALTAFGKSLSEEFGPKGVRVNTVSPGVVRTAIWEDPEGFGGKAAAAAGVGHAEFLEQLPGRFGMARGSPSPARSRRSSPSCSPTWRPTSPARTTSSTAAR